MSISITTKILHTLAGSKSKLPPKISANSVHHVIVQSQTDKQRKQEI